jgi:hypothetical protein
MPPLIDKWNGLRDEDKNLFPLLEVSSFFVILLCYLNFIKLFKSVYQVLQRLYNQDLWTIVSPYFNVVFH